MSISRWLFRYPRESLRLANLYLNAAERRGVPSPSQSILVVAYHGPESGFRWASTIFKNESFTPAEVRAVLDQVRKQPELAVAYIPDVFPTAEQEAIEGEFLAHDKEYMQPARAAFYRLIRSKGVQSRWAFEAEYDYNIVPVYDDRPFFFEYHKVFERARGDDRNQLDLRGTIVHYTLFFLLAITGLVAFSSMILPLDRFHREGLRVTGVWSLLAFFSSLGVGFMFIEMGLIHALNLYLGHPMYSLSIVLAGLLLFSGVGSYLAGALTWQPPRLLTVGMLGTAGTVMAWSLAMNILIPLTFKQSSTVRVVVTIVSLLPVGLMMGIPFATGLRLLLERHERFIPWVWGINGLTSVMASILAIILAMRVGFQLVLYLGAINYVLGWVAVRRFLNSPSPAEKNARCTLTPLPEQAFQPVG